MIVEWRGGYNKKKSQNFPKISIFIKGRIIIVFKNMKLFEYIVRSKKFFFFYSMNKKICISI